ncbi:hypothetical protein H5410_036181 [Solanum commersonii]|uniref:Uncharacterized protein n=1 Tax=Solanum commersonii TaxID=4109 RepID=A0A9J5Y421_SOLCO|nr:hypothetical protein H5410_036181 [Solanum commersonii]
MENMGEAAGGGIGELPTTYLGMPLVLRVNHSFGMLYWRNVKRNLCHANFYMMSLFPMPVNVIKKLDAIRRDFLWQLTRGQNHSLPLKWLWRFGTDGHSSWKETILTRYGMEEHLITKEVKNPYGNGGQIPFWDDQCSGKLLNDWEVERLTDFFNTRKQFKNFSTNDDSLFWLKDKQGSFSVNLHISASTTQILNQGFGLGR